MFTAKTEAENEIMEFWDGAAGLKVCVYTADIVLGTELLLCAGNEHVRSNRVVNEELNVFLFALVIEPSL